MKKISILLTFIFVVSGCATSPDILQTSTAKSENQTTDSKFHEYHNAIIGCVVGTLITFNPLVCGASAGVAYYLFDRDK